jgi:hypothetical protein
LQQFIRTIHKKGFRFVAELEIEEYQQELEKAKAALMRELPEFSCAFRFSINNINSSITCGSIGCAMPFLHNSKRPVSSANSLKR